MRHIVNDYLRHGCFLHHARSRHSGAGFRLRMSLSGKTVKLADFADKKALLVMFVCAHCPYVVHVRPELARLSTRLCGPERGIRRRSRPTTWRDTRRMRPSEAAMARAADDLSRFFTTSRRPWRRPTRPHARRIFSSSMRRGSWSIAGNLTARGRGAGRIGPAAARSMARTSVPPSRRCWRTSR